MNDAVYKFKRYEDNSLDYTGIDTHKGTIIGGWDTAIDRSQLYSKEDPKKMPGPHVEEKERIKQESKKETTQKQVPRPLWSNLQVGDAVQHKTFGQGVVKSIDDRFIIVAFATKESRFLHPWVFEQGYLSIM